MAAASVASMSASDAAPSLVALQAPPGAPERVAADEQYWAQVRNAFRDEPGQVWLAHGAGGAVPTIVMDQMANYAAEAASGAWDLPAFRDMKESASSQALRERMARTFGCDTTEIGLTRNAMEGLATCLLGFDLRAGDEILTTTGDYDSCIAILKQRERREGTSVRLVDLPIPATSTEAILKAIGDAMTSRTRMLLISHMLYGTGQILPVREICALARARGVLSIVDGAHSIGHIKFRIDQIGCDCFASCLHKWFMAPRGTGILYVRKERIKDIWPLFAPYTNKAATDIEKFEECGTVSKAVAASLPLAFDFNDMIGIEVKQARLRHLRDRWAKPLQQEDRIHFWTDLDPRWSCGVGAFQIDGIEPATIVTELHEKHRLRVRTLGNPYLPNVRGINIGASLVNTLEQLDRLVAALRQIMRTN